jgi:hypothetical protein
MSDYVEELTERARQLAEIDANLHPPTPAPSAEERLFGLRQYDATGPGPVIGGDMRGSYEAAGIDPKATDFCTALRLQPAVALQLLAVMNNEAEPDHNYLLSGYLFGAPSLQAAADARSAHLQEAAAVLDKLGHGDRKPALERLPRSALAMIVGSVEVQERAKADREKLKG